MSRRRIPSRFLSRHQRNRPFAVESLEHRVLLSASDPVPFVPSTLLRAGNDILSGGVSHIVAFRDQAAESDSVASDLAVEYDFTISQVYEHVLRGFAANLNPEQVRALRSDPQVEFVEKDQFFTIAQQTLPSGVDRVDADQSATAKIDEIDGPDGSAERVDVDIAILDTGIDLDHPDLNTVAGFASSALLFGPFAFCGNNTTSVEDGNGHGTHVAGSAAALDNAQGVVGVAPGARVIAVKVLADSGGGCTSDIIAGMDFVTQNASTIEVANMSLSGPDSPALKNAIANARNAGVVTVVAAGNDMTDIVNISPANSPHAFTVSALADYDGIPGGQNDTTVNFSSCSETEDDSFACFSNYGAVDGIAPGVNILSTWTGGGYNTISGTSMASPHVAGAVALYIQEHGRANNGAGVDAIKQALINAGDPAPCDTGNGQCNDDPDGVQEPLIKVAGNLPVNDPPDAVNDSYSVNEGGTLNANDVDGSANANANDNGLLANDSDPNGDNLAAQTTTISGPSNGSVTIAADGTFQYVHDGSETTNDSFVYRVCDDGVPTRCSDATANITINPVNDLPTAQPVNTSTTEGNPVGVGLSGSDVETCELTFSIVSGPSNGNLGAINNNACLPGVPNNDSASVTYTPNGTFTGGDSFTYKVNDGTDDSPEVTVNVQVNAMVNNPPDAVNDNYTVAAGETLNANDADGTGTPGDDDNGLLANDSDPDGDNLTAQVTTVSGPSNGNVTIAADGTFEYTHDGGSSTSDSFVYRVCDDGSPSMCSDATASIAVQQPGPSGVHVGDLDGSANALFFGFWQATVTVTIHDSSENPVSGAQVSGSWSTGFGGTTSCTTNASGVCNVNRTVVGSSATFTVNDVMAAQVYVPGDNHDPDGDSDGTSISVNQP